MRAHADARQASAAGSGARAATPSTAERSLDRVALARVDRALVMRLEERERLSVLALRERRHRRASHTHDVGAEELTERAARLARLRRQRAQHLGRGLALGRRAKL